MEPAWSIADLDRRRCPWAESNELLRAYHDEEWGVPVRDDRGLFEALTLEGAQAGLSWLTVLKRRPNYREAFLDFDLARVAKFTARDRARLLKNPGLIRHAGKINSVVTNARAILKITAEHRGFLNFLGKFRDPEALSRALKTHGLSFVGPTICRAFMQATGLINDHVPGCFRHGRISGARGRGKVPI